MRKTQSGEKVVTHADLNHLRTIKECASEIDLCISADSPTGRAVIALLDRLIAVAEADAPPLPEGWVLHSEGGHQHPYYHERGWLYRGCDVDGGCVVVARVGEVRFTRDRLTPLRPTVQDKDDGGEA